MICQNVCIFSGRVGGEPEAISLDNGASILKFSMAIDRPTRKEDGSWDSNTSWADMEFYEASESSQGNKIRSLQKGQEIAVHASYQEKKNEIDGKNRSFKSFKVQQVFVSKPAQEKSSSGSYE